MDMAQKADTVRGGLPKLEREDEESHSAGAFAAPGLCFGPRGYA